jgi:predicted small metal-binding protein
MMSDSKPVLKFKCVDGGAIECKWEGSSTDEELLLFQIEQHARDHHNLILDDKGQEKIRAAIRREP